MVTNEREYHFKGDIRGRRSDNLTNLLKRLVEVWRSAKYIQVVDSVSLNVDFCFLSFYYLVQADHL
jgi:hypothetical protein